MRPHLRATAGVLFDAEFLLNCFNTCMLHHDRLGMRQAPTPSSDRSVVSSLRDACRARPARRPQSAAPHAPAGAKRRASARGGEWGEQTLQQACSQAYPGSAMCVQNFDDSLNSAIRITYRISLRSSSLREPRYPLLKVVKGLQKRKKSTHV